MTTYPYDTLAASVKPKDITSCRNNRAVLHRIKNNDPALTRLYIIEADEDDDLDGVAISSFSPSIFLMEGDDLGWLGYYIGENKTLETLKIYHLLALPAQEQIENFFNGLQRNKSIKDIYCHGSLVGTLGEGLSAINLPHVTNMSMDYDPDEEEEFHFEMAHYFALGLQRCKALVNYRGPMTAEIVTSLTALPMLENVTFCIGPGISSDECVALRGLLINATNMKLLDISYIGLGNEGLAILTEGLACNASLTDGVLHLSNNGIGDEDLQALAFSLVGNTKLRELDLAENDIGDVGLEALADSLVHNRALRKLSLSGNTAITANGMRSVSRILQSSGLEDLCFDEIDISDEGGNILADALSVNQTLVSLSLRNWFRGAGRVRIGDVGLRALAHGLSRNSHLEFLDLSGHSAITPSGLRYLREYFGSQSCALKELKLCGINIGDEGAHALGYALYGNKSLSSLYFDERDITLIGWGSFLKLICDSTSPNRLYLSNHTLCHLGDSTRLSGSDVKDSVAIALEIHLCQRPRLVAKFKILCFIPDLDMVPLFQWNLKFLPLLKRWFEVVPWSNHESEAGMRCRNIELSSIFKFVRGLSVLVVDGLRERERLEMQAGIGRNENSTSVRHDV